MKVLNKTIEKVNIRALVNNYILEIIGEDIQHFGITKYKLCNLILIKFSLKYRSNYFQEMSYESKSYLQFALHKENIIYYNELKKGIDINESEMIREIFSSYAILPAFLREIHLFKEKISFLMTAQKEYRVLKLHTKFGVVEGRIEVVLRDKESDYLKVIVNGSDYFVSQLEVIN